VLEDPRALAAGAPDLRLRVIAEIAIAVTEAPWSLSRDHLTRAYAATLSDEDVLQVIALTSYFGHLNRIAEVVGVPLDYDVTLIVSPADRARPAWACAPGLLAGKPALDLARRPQTHAALAGWRQYAFYRDAPLTRRQRTLLARWVAYWIGDGGISPPTDLTTNPHDDALRAFAEGVTLGPWLVSEAHLAPLRAAGFDDDALFDATATITSAGVFSRIEVALAALAS
jgi:alkylhydroperoxidase family enzyme